MILSWFLWFVEPNTIDSSGSWLLNTHVHKSLKPDCIAKSYLPPSLPGDPKEHGWPGSCQLPILFFSITEWFLAFCKATIIHSFFYLAPLIYSKRKHLFIHSFISYLINVCWRLALSHYPSWVLGGGTQCIRELNSLSSWASWKKETSQKQISRPSTVAHGNNPSYLKGEDQEDCSSSPAQAKSFWDSISTNKSWHGGMNLSSQLCGKHK
jgi:hypothetical protein